jgi:hypothetical protein
MTKQPPVPPANRSSKGPDGGTASDGEITRQDAKRANRIDNRKEQGQAGNLAQNTRNQGYQQDR